jgi:hypothetical protein
VRPLGAGEEQEPTWGPGDPFALVHVPTSEYLPASDGEGDEAAALIHSEFFAARISRTDAQRVEWVNLAEVAKERRQAPPPREERG